MCILVCPRCRQEEKGCIVHGEFRKNKETNWKSGSFLLSSCGCNFLNNIGPGVDCSFHPDPWLHHWDTVLRAVLENRKFSVYCHSVHCHCVYLGSPSSHYLLKIFQWFPTAYRKAVQTQPAIQGPLYLISAYCFPSHTLIRHFLLTYRKTKRIVFPWNTRGICILCILSPISSWPKSLCSLRPNSNLYRIPPSKLLLLLRTLLAFHLLFKGFSFPFFHPVTSVLSLSRYTLSFLGQNISQIGLWFLTVLCIALYF